MRIRHSLRVSLAVVTVAASVAAFGAASAATAAEETGTETTVEVGPKVDAGFKVLGYDEKVAEANGYKIVKHEDGTWESVPVTEEAKAAEAGATGGVEAYRAPVYVTGSCGNSWIQFIRAGNHVTVKTGYNVTHPVANRINWAVQVWSWDGNPYFQWPNGPSPSSWTGSAGFFNTVGGQGYVLPASSVLLINGTICGSYSPSSAI